MRTVAIIISAWFFCLYDRVSRYVDALYGIYMLNRLAQVGVNCRIKGKGTIVGANFMRLGRDVAIGEGLFAVANGEILIDDYSIISRNCVIQTQTHNYNSDLLPFGREMLRKPVFIGKSVWIGMNVTILPGVVIGDGAIIGMNSVVTKSVPACAICVGSPARVIKYRDKEKYDKLFNAGRFITQERSKHRQQ